METAQARHSPQTRSGASIVGEGRSFMTAMPNEAQSISAGSHRLNILFHSIRAACERSEIHHSRVSDVSATGTERSETAKAVERFTARLCSGVGVKEVESSESRAPLLHKTCARQSAVFGVAVQSQAQTRRNEHRSRSERTRQSPQSVAHWSAAVAPAQPQCSRV
jgi:hypothetical protein